MQVWFNAVKCNLTKLATKSSWYLRSVVFVWYSRLSTLHHCTNQFQRGSPWHVLDVRLSNFLHIFGLFIDVFLPYISIPYHGRHEHFNPPCLRKFQDALFRPFGVWPPKTFTERETCTFFPLQENSAHNLRSSNSSLSKFNKVHHNFPF